MKTLKDDNDDMDATDMDGTTDAVRAVGSKGTAAASPPLTTGTRSARAVSASWLRDTRSQRHRQRVATYRRMFSRYLPFTGWRLPIQVESAIGRFKRLLGGPRYGVMAMSARSSVLGIDFDRGIWRTSSLESLERRKFFSVSPGHVDEAYVDDSWADLSAGDAAAWSTAAGDEIPLVYGYDAFATIAEGVAATEGGGILNIATGGYSEILTTLGKGLTIRAGGDAAAEVAVDGLQLAANDTLEFDLPGVSRHDQISLRDGASVFDLGAARIAVAESADLPTDGSAVLGLITSERGVSVGPTGTVYDRTGRPLADETILSSSRLNFRFDGESGDFQGVFLTPVLPQTEVVVDGLLAGDLASRVSVRSQTLGSGGTIGTANVLPSLVYVYDAWTGSTPGDTVTYGSISATFGTNAFATIGTGLAGVAVSGTVDVIAGTAGIYNEQLTISQDVTIAGIEPSAPVTAMGADEAAAVLDGAGLFGAGITVTGAGVDLTLRNITFSNWLDGSILVQNGGSAVVENVTINGDVSGVASVTRGMRVEAGSTLNVSKSIVQAGDNNYGANNGIQVTGAGAVFTLSNSSVTGSSSVNQVGVAVSGGTATVTNSFVTGNFYGILFSNASNGSVTGNFLAGNTQSAVRNSTSNSAVIDASTNWWGVTTEAAVLAKTSSTGGSRVDITPYLLDGTDTGNVTAGFQGDYSQLAVTTLGPQVGSTGRIQEGVTSIANGSLTGIDRVLEVNTGNYTGATNVSQSLTLETASFNLNSSLTFSAPSQVAEAANGGGTAITVLNGAPGNDLAVNANLAFVGNGTLSLTSGNGSIVGSGVISAGTLSLTSTNGSITASTDAASLAATAKGDITIGDAGDITFTGVTSSTGNVGLTAVGTLATSGSVAATVGDVSLTGATLALAGTTTAGDSLALEATAGNVTLLAANLSIGQDLSVVASGAITQDGALTVPGNTGLDAGSGINLMAANVFSGAVAISSVGDVALNDSTPLAFANSTITGNLAVTAGGAITAQYFSNAQVLQITGTTSLSAGSANDITLDGANDFGGAVSILSGKNVSLNDANAIDLGASAISGNLAVTADGSITDSGVLNVTGTTSLNATSANDITLDEANVFGGAVSVVAGRNVSLNDTGALDLGPSTISGNLFQVTAGGAITDSGNLSVSGNTELTAGSGNNITLNNANDFTGSVSVVSGKNVTLVDTSAIDLAASTISGNLAVTANGTITDGGALNVAGTTTLAAGTITPSETAAWTSGTTAGTVDGVVIGASGGTAQLGDFATPDYAPALTAAQSYLDYGVNETITLTFNAPVTQVDLYLYYWRGPGPSGGPAAYTFTTDGTSALAIQSGLTGASTTNLTLNSASGFMNGVLRVTGTFTTLTITPGTGSGTSAQGLTLTAVAAPVAQPYDIVLDDANDFGGAFNVTSAANVTVRDTDNLTLGAVTAAGGVTATAAASLNVATSVAGSTVSLTAAEINLPGSITASKAATLDATGGNVSGAGLVTAGTVTANATGLIDLQTDATLFAGTAGSDLTVTDTGSISLNGVTATAGNVSVTSNGSITVQSAVTAGQDVTLNASLGSISGAGLVTADHVTADAASSLSLNLAANSLDATSADGNVVVTDSGDLTLGTVTAPGSETSVNVTASGNLTVATSVAASDRVSLRGATLQLNGTTTAGTDATLNATAGSIQGDGLVTANAITVSATGDAILNVSAQSITASTGSDFGVSAASALDLTGLTVGGNATIAANGSITDSGALTVNGTTTLTAGSANNITLDDANDFVGAVSVVSGNDVTLNDTGDIALGTSTISGNLAVTAGDSITSSGVVSAVGVNATAVNSIVLNLAAASLDATANGSITVTEADAITLGNVTSTAGTIDVTAGGPLTVGSNGTVSANQSLTLTGSTLAFSGTTISGSDITLNATAGDIDVGGLNLGGNLSATAAGELTVDGTLEAVGDITLTGANVAIGSGVTAGDDVFLNATAGNISGSGLVSGDAVSATATGSIDLNLAAASLLATAAGDITVVESDALTLDGVLSTNGTARVTAGGSLTVGTKGVTAADVYLTGSNIAVDQSITSGSGVTLNATAGSISGSGLITGNLLRATAANGSVAMTTNVATVTGASNGSFSVTESSGLTLGNVSSAAGDVGVEAEGSLDINGSVSAGANVTLTSTNGSIAGPGSVSGALLTASAANGSIAVATSVSSLTATANGSITLTDTDSITLAGVTSTAGNVAVTAGGDIVVSSNVTSASDVLLNATAGNISGPALILADAVTATATGSIGLNLEEAILNATAGGNITVNDYGTTLLETVNSTGGNVTVLSYGDLTVNGSVAAFTDVTLKGSSVTLTGTTTAGTNATLQALGGNLSGSGLVTADAVFAEALDDARSINLNLATARLDARADRDITVANNGSLTLGVVDSNGGNLAMTVAGDLVIGPDDDETPAVIIPYNATLNVTGGNISGPGTLAASSVNATASGSIDLALEATNLAAAATGNITVVDEGTLVLNTVTSTAGNVTISSGALVVNGSTTAAGNDVTLTATTGNISGSGLISADAVNATAAGSIALNLAAASLTANAPSSITVTEADSLVLQTVTSTAGNVTVTAGGDLTVGTSVSAQVDLSLTGSNITLDGLIQGRDDITLNATAGGIVLRYVDAGDALTVVANGPITQEGSLPVNGLLTLSAGSANDIVLSNYDSNYLANVVVLSGRNVSLRSDSAMDLGASTISGNLAVTANGSITDSGALLVSGTTSLDAGSSNDITLDAASNFDGAVSVVSGNSVTLNDTGAIDLGGSTISGNLAVTADGAISDSGNLSVAGTTSLTAGAANDITLDDANDFGGAVSVVSGNDVTLNDTAAIDLGASTISGNLAITANGTITDSGPLSVTGTTSLTAGAANDITLDADNNFGSAVSVVSGRNVSLNDTGAIALGGSTISGNLTVTANGAITDSGNLAVSGTTSLTAGAANDITLDAANTFGGAVSVVSGKNVTLVDTDAIDLGASTVSGNLTVTANGSITDSGVLAISGTTTLSAGSAHDITLDALNDFVGAVSITSGRNVTVRDVDDIDFGASTISGNLSVTANGSITDSAAISVAGTTSLTSLGIVPGMTSLSLGQGSGFVGPVVLTGSASLGDVIAIRPRSLIPTPGITLDADNDFTGAVSASAPGDVVINDVSAIVLGESTIGGSLTITANGAITDTGNLSITGTTSLTAGSANDITLDADNDFGGSVSVVSGNNVSLNDIGDIDLGASTVSGNLIIAAKGSITDSGALTITGTTNLTSLGLIPTAPVVPTVIVLDAANDFVGAVSMIANGNAVLNDINSIDLGASTVLGNLTITANGAITDSGDLSISRTTSLTAGAANDITLDAANNFGDTVSVVSGNDVTLNDTGAIDLGASTVSGNLSVTAVGSITDSGNLSANGTTTLTAGSASDITLDAANTFGGAVSVVSGKDVTLNATSSIDLGASTISGNLAVTADGSITDSGVLSVTGTTWVTAGEANDITLDAANDFGGAVTVFLGRNVTLNDSGSLALSAYQIAGNLTVTANGAITDSDALNVTGTTSLTAGPANDITLDDANNFGGAVSVASGNNVTLNDTGAITLAASTISGNLVVTANGSITDSGNLAIAGTTSLTAGSANDITLNDANNFGGAVSVVSGGNVTLNDTSAIDLGASTISGKLTVTANGSITDSGALNVTGNTSLTAGSANDITLDDANNFGGAVSVASGNNVTLNDTGAITLAASTISGNLVVTANGSINDSGNLAIAGTTSLTAGSANDITLNDTNNFGGAVSVVSGNNVTLSDKGAIDLAAMTVSGRLNVTANGSITDSGVLSVTGTTRVTAGSANDITLDAANDFGGAVTVFRGRNVTLNDIGSLALSAFQIAGNLTVTANGAITDSDAINVTGTTSLSAGSANDITLDARNNFGGAVSVVSGKDVTLNASSSIDLGASTISGNLAVTAKGEITDSGALNVTGNTTLTTGSGADITLDDANNFGGAVSVVSGKNVTLNDTGAIDLGASTISGTFTVTANGSITDSGSLSVTGTTSLTAGSANDITLDAANDFGGAVSVVSGKDVTLNDVSAIDLGAAAISGNLTVTANGSITDSGVLAVTGTTSLSAGSANDITLDADNDFGTVNTSGSAVTLVDTNGLTLGDTTASSLSVTANGSIAQAAGSTINVTGTTTLAAGSGNSITLAEATNDFGTVNGSVSSSGVLTINDANGIILGNITAQASQGLNVTANGSITQAAGSAIVVFGSRFDSTGHDITLDSVANDFQSNIETTAVGANVTLVDSNALYPAATTAGNLALTANGVIADYGPINVTGTTTLSAGSANAITLDHPANNFGGAVSVVSGKDVTLVDTGAIDLGASTVSGNLTVTANGSITDSGVLAVVGATSLAAGATNDITLDQANIYSGPVSVVSGNNVTLVADSGLNLAASTISGSLSVTTAGDATLEIGGAVGVGTGATLTAGQVVVSDTLTAAGNVTLNATGGNISGSGLVSADVVNATATESIQLNLAAASLDATANGSITVTEADALTLGNVASANGSVSIVGDELTVNGTVNANINASLEARSGNITGPGSVVSPSVQLYANNGTVDLDTTAAQITTRGDNGVAIRNNGSLVLGLAESVAGNVSVAANGSLTVVKVEAGDIAALTATGNLTVDANGTGVFAGSDLTLTGGNIAIDGSVATGGAGGAAVITLNATAGSISGAGLVEGEAVNALATGAITLNLNATSLSASATGDVVVGEADDLILDAISSTLGNVSVTAAGNLTVAASGTVSANGSAALQGVDVILDGSTTAGTNVTLQAVGGNISGAGLVTAPEVGATAMAGSIDLNLATGWLDASADGDITATNNGSLALGMVTSNGSLTVSATGNLTQAGSEDITTVGNVSLTGTTIALNGTTNTSADVTLNATAGNITMAGLVTADAVNATATGSIGLNLAAASLTATSLTATASGDITVTEANAITLEAVSSTAGNVSVKAGDIAVNGSIAAVGHDVALNSTTGDITGSGLVTADAVNTHAQCGSITLNLAAASLNVSSRNDIVVTEQDAISVTEIYTLLGNATVTAGGNLAVDGSAYAGGDLSLVGSNITLNAATEAGRDMTLNATAGGIVLQSLTIGSNLTVDASGPITQSGSLGVPGTTNLAAGSANDITLDDANDFGGAVSVVSGKNVTLNDTSGIDLGASTISGNLAVTASGSITDSGSLNVTGTTSLAAGGANDITLDDANDFGGAVSVISGNDVVINDTGAVDLGAMSVSGNLTVTADGSITDSGSLAITGTTSLAAGSANDITLDDANNFGGAVSVASGKDVTLNDTIAIDLGASTISGNLAVTANGTITDSGDLSITGTTTLTAGSSHDITLDAANDFGGAVSVVSGKNVSLNDTGAIDLGASTVSGNLTVTAQGAMTDSGDLNVTGTTSLTAGSANDITLDAANNFGGVVTVSSGKDVTLNDTGAIDLGASTVSGNLAVTANGSITDSGDLSIAGTTSLTAGSANDITLDAANDFGGAVSVVSGKDVVLNDTGAIDLGGSTISGNLTVTAGGPISSSGTVTAGDVSATTSAEGISLTLTTDSVTAAAPGSISISQVGNQSVTVTNINSTAGNITLSTDGTTAGHGMTVDTLVANGGAGRVTLAGGVEFLLTSNTTYTQSDISAATLNLSAATLLGSIATGYNPPVDQTYDIINTSATTTAFSNAANGVVFGNVAFAIDYTGNVTLTAGLPTLVYVDDLWAGSTPGQTVSSGSYTGTFGYNAFATISTGVAGVATTGLVGVIEGLYNESITVSRDVTIEGIQPAVPTTEMGAAAGAAMLDGTGLFTAAITASGAGIDLIVSNLQFSEWINGAVLIQGGAAATLTNVTVVGELAGVAASFGVRLQGAGSSLTLDKSIISAGSSAGPNNGVQVTGGTFTMTNSSVSGSASAGQVGVALTGGTAIVSNSFITGNFLGLTFSNTATGTLSGNDLTGNSAYAVRNGTVSSTINASGNWWGAITESGVLAKTFSTGSSGSRVDISPYLLDGTDTGNATAGFQGDFSQLAVTTLGSQAGANAIQEGVDAIANGTLSGVNRILVVNSGTYSGATDVNRSLTLTTSAFTLTNNLTISADIQAAEVTGGGGTAITVNGAGNNLATNANLAFTGTGTLALKLGSGSIAGPGVISASALTLSAANGSINVASDAGTVTLTSLGDATIADVGAIDLAASTIGGTLAVTANGSITESGVLNVTGSASLAAGSANDITLDAANVFGGSVSVASGRNVVLNDTGAIDLAASTISGNLTVTTNGSITDSGSLNVNGSTSLAAGSTNDITLDNTNNFGGAVSVVSGKDVTLNDTGVIDLGASTVSGNLAVTANGSITDSGVVNVTGSTSLAAGSANDITLDAANNFGGAVGVASGRNVALNDTGAIDLAASTISGNLTVTANGSITDSGSLNVTGRTSLSAGSANDITLDAANNFVNAVSVVSGKDVTLNDTGGIDLGGSTISGNLAVIANGWIDRHSGGLNVTGTTSLTAGSANDITLDAANNFGGAVSVVSGKDVTLNDTGAIDLGASTISGNLTVTANGSITDSGNLAITGTTSLTAGSANDITLDAANVFGDTVSVVSGRNVTLNDTTSLTLGASAVSGNLALTTAGNVSQVGGLTVAGTAAITAGTAAGPIVYTIDLSNAGNDFGGAVSAAGATDVYLTDANAIVLGTIPAASLAVTALAGSITGSGPIVVSGGTTLAAGASDITLLGANDFGPVTVTSGRNVALNDVSAIQLNDMAVSGNLTLTTNGLVQSFGNLSITGTTTIAAGSANNILLNTANDFGGAVSITSGRNVTLNDTGAITLGASTISGNLAITAGGAIGDAGTVEAGNVSATTSAGGITLTLTADSVTASAPGSIDLSQVGNQSVTFSSVNSTGGNVVLSTDGTTFGHGMTIDTLSAASNGTVTLSGGIEFMINNGTSYTQSDVPSGQVVLSGATLLVARNAAYYPTLGTQFTLIDSATPISGTFDGVAENGTVNATGVVLRANYTNDLTLTTQSTVPLVTNVYVNSSAWLSGFKSYLATSSQGSATLGYAIPTGTAATFNRNTPNQLNTLSWTNMNQISVSFSEDVVIAQADFALTGVNVASYAISGFSYGEVGGVWTATWTLGSNLGADKLMVNVPATVVARGGGLQLAGAWTQPTPSTAGSAMPSGGSPGTAFAFRVNSLPGDVNTNTAVTNQDLSITRAAAGTTPGVGLYTIFKDVNGNGAITNQDLSLVQARLATTLPAGEPVAYTFPSASSAAFDESAATSGVMTMDEARQAAWAALTTDGTVDTSKKRSPFGGFGL